MTKDYVKLDWMALTREGLSSEEREFLSRCAKRLEYLEGKFEERYDIKNQTKEKLSEQKSPPQALENEPR